MNANTLGSSLVTVWSGLNLVLAAGILVAMALGFDPPSLTMTFPAAELASLDPRALALIKALAVLFNACAGSLCGAVLVLTWRGVVQGLRWALGTVTFACGLVQAVGFWSDAYLGNHNLLANLGSTLVLGVGLGACWWHRVRSHTTATR